MLDWISYKKQFIAKAEERGFDEEHIQIFITYAYSLVSENLPIIFDRDHFSLLVGYRPDLIDAIYFSPHSFYRHYQISKKSGGYRYISEPLPTLKEIQRWILDNILYTRQPSKFAKGFVPQKSIRENSRFHRKQTKVLSLDIENFFMSIDAARVYNFYWRLGYQKSVAHLLTRLSTLAGSLPQGAPTSPALSNLISIRLDRRLAGFALKRKIRYTRYADDITFSGDFDEGQIIKFVRKVLGDEGYKLNEKKTRLMKRHQKQEVTGIVVNEKLQAPRKTRKEIRQAIYYIKKFGLDSHIQYTQIKKANYVKHLLGIANFILFVNPKDEEVKDYVEFLHKLLREK